MSNTFEWTRFTKVVRKDWHNMLRHCTSIIFMAASPAIAWLFTWMMNSVTSNNFIMDPGVRIIWILAMACLASLLAPAFLYNTFNQPKHGIYFAMLPASKLEKYLSIILYTVIVYPLAVILCGVVVDLFLSLLPFGIYKDFLWQTSWENSMMAAAFNDVKMSDIPCLSSPLFWIAIAALGYLSNAGMYLFGATFFKNHKFLFTILWYWLITTALQIILMPFGGIWLSNSDFLDNLSGADPIAFTSSACVVGLIFNAIITGVFFWWAGHRLKKMSY